MKTSKHIDKKILQLLMPINQLGPDVISELSTVTFFETLSKGEQVFVAGFTDEWVYIISGNVVIIAPDAKVVGQLEGGSVESKHPLVHNQPREATVVAVNDVIFIRIVAHYTKNLLLEPVIDQYGSVAAVEDGVDPALQIFNEIRHDVDTDKLIVPSLPDIAIKVRAAVQHPDANTVSVATLVQTDPPLAARLIQVANSPLYRGMSAITNCRVAVSRLGLKVTQDLVIGCSLQQLFESDSTELKTLMTAIWKQSTYVGAISAVIARFSPHLDVDRALFVGLMHNIGTLPILEYGKKYLQLVADVDFFQSIMKEMMPRVGALVMRRWQFDAEMEQAIQNSQDWLRDSDKKADYCDVILLAQLYSFIGTEQAVDYPAFDEIPAFKKLRLSRMGEAMTVRVLNEARADIEDIQRLLQG